MYKIFLQVLTLSLIISCSRRPSDANGFHLAIAGGVPAAPVSSIPIVLTIHNDELLKNLRYLALAINLAKQQTHQNQDNTALVIKNFVEANPASQNEPELISLLRDEKLDSSQVNELSSLYTPLYGDDHFLCLVNPDKCKIAVINNRIQENLNKHTLDAKILFVYWALGAGAGTSDIKPESGTVQELVQKFEYYLNVLIFDRDDDSLGEGIATCTGSFIDVPKIGTGSDKSALAVATALHCLGNNGIISYDNKADTIKREGIVKVFFRNGANMSYINNGCINTLASGITATSSTQKLLQCKVINVSSMYFNQNYFPKKLEAENSSGNSIPNYYAYDLVLLYPQINWGTKSKYNSYETVEKGDFKPLNLVDSSTENTLESLYDTQNRSDAHNPCYNSLIDAAVKVTSAIFHKKYVCGIAVGWGCQALAGIDASGRCNNIGKNSSFQALSNVKIKSTHKNDGLLISADHFGYGDSGAPFLTKGNGFTTRDSSLVNQSIGEIINGAAGTPPLALGLVSARIFSKGLNIFNKTLFVDFQSQASRDLFKIYHDQNQPEYSSVSSGIGLQYCFGGPRSDCKKRQWFIFNWTTHSIVSDDAHPDPFIKINSKEYRYKDVEIGGGESVDISNSWREPVQVNASINLSDYPAIATVSVGGTSSCHMTLARIAEQNWAVVPYHCFQNVTDGIRDICEKQLPSNTVKFSNSIEDVNCDADRDSVINFNSDVVIIPVTVGSYQPLSVLSQNLLTNPNPSSRFLDQDSYDIDFLMVANDIFKNKGDSSLNLSPSKSPNNEIAVEEFAGLTWYLDSSINGEFQAAGYNFLSHPIVTSPSDSGFPIVIADRGTKKILCLHVKGAESQGGANRCVTGFALKSLVTGGSDSVDPVDEDTGSNQPPVSQENPPAQEETPPEEVDPIGEEVTPPTEITTISDAEANYKSLCNINSDATGFIGTAGISPPAGGTITQENNWNFECNPVGPYASYPGCNLRPLPMPEYDATSTKILMPRYTQYPVLAKAFFSGKTYGTWYCVYKTDSKQGRWLWNP